MARKITMTPKPDLSKTNDMTTIGNLVRHKRTTLGITLEDAASLCHLSKQAYSNVEKGLESVRVETLLKVLNALGIQLAVSDTAEVAEVSNDWF
ncbi:helix-turn-helix domain-containing protein [Pseudidiomarina donghaiensis]|uniref:helix-turn-helix domain-containing protein n=1 Tax=Pseudidiomarina donghaiensis TaxID=519452 RepID=UPI003A986AA0